MARARRPTSRAISSSNCHRQDKRYVLNISKNGYALFSRVLFEEFVGAKFSLVKAQTSTMDPQKPIEVTETFPQKIEQERRFGLRRIRSSTNRVSGVRFVGNIHFNNRFARPDRTTAW